MSNAGAGKVGWRGTPATLIGQRRADSGVPEVGSLVEERFAGRDGEGVGKRITEVQLGAVPRPFAEVAICLPSQPCVLGGDRDDRDGYLRHETIEANAVGGVRAAI